MAADPLDFPQETSPDTDREARYAGKVPSPTSKYGLNLRFFHVADPNTRLAADVDIGTDLEEMLEEAYAARYPQEADRTHPITRAGFQAVVRVGMVTGMLMDLNIWPFALTLTASLGDDTAVKVIEAHRQHIIAVVDQVVEGPHRGQAGRPGRPPRPRRRPPTDPTAGDGLFQ